VYCYARDWDFDEVTEETWVKVRDRDWIADPVAGVPDSGGPR
jgi:hypothetical protein